MSALKSLRHCWLLMLLLMTAAPGWSQVNVLTQHNDVSRSGANLSETLLTPANVNVNSFGKLFSLPTDGQVYAQPLYVSALSVAGVTHNVVYIATAHNSVYAYDADTGISLWQVNLGPSIPSADINTPNMPIEIGITSTPVIDPATQTLYCVAATKESGTYLYRIHALDLTTGLEKMGGPTVIQASVPGTGDASVNGIITFNPIKQHNRSGLLLLNGNIYLTFASHEDYNPYHGWIMAYNAATLQQTAVFNDTPNGSEGGIWQAGQGLVADAAGSIYLMTGNGTTSAPTGGSDYGEAFLKMSLAGNTLAVNDWFIPNNFASLNAQDEDLGSAGVLGIPGTNLIVGGGKQGVLYLLNTANLGHYNAGTDPVLQEFQAVHSRGSTGHIHGSPIFWSGPTGSYIYVWGENDVLRAYPFYPATQTASAYIGTTASSVGADYSPALTTVYGMPGGFLSLSANGNQNGIVWATTPYDGDADHAVVHGILRAFDATNLSSELWNTKMLPARDDFGLFAKFNPPTIANGKVYLATFSNQVCVYGKLPPPSAFAGQTTLTATAGSGQVVLNWPTSSYATSYNVYSGLAPGAEAAAPIVTGVTATTYANTGLTNGTTYYYTVVAVNAAGQSAPSAEASATPAAAAGTMLSLRFGGSLNGVPGLMAATESAGVIPAVGWNNIVGSSGTVPSLLDNLGGSTGASVNWLAGGLWKLPTTEAAGNARMMKGYLDTGTSTTVTIANLPTSLIASGYDVYICADGDNGAVTRTASYSLGGVTQVVKDAAGVNFGGTFTQSIASSAGNYLVFPNQTASSFTLTATALTTSSGVIRAPINSIEIVAHPAPAAPVSLTATAGSGQVVLNWPTSPYAASYNIYSGLAPGAEAAAPIATGVTKTTYTNTGLTNGTTYYYTVVAINAAGQSAPSTEASATPIAAAGTMLSLRFGGSATGVPGLMAPTESAGVVPAVGWNNVVGSSGTVPSLLDNLGGSTGASVNWQAGSLWSLPITESAGNARMMKGYLDTGTSTTVTIANLPTSLIASGYDVYVCADGDNGAVTRTASYSLGGTIQVVKDNASTNFSGVFKQSVSGSAGNYLVFPNQTASSFTLTATVGTSGNAILRAPINSIEIVAHPAPASLAAPASLTATKGNGQVVLNWSAVPYAVSYNVYSGLAPGAEAAAPIATGVTATTYTNTGLTNGTPYYYTVVAVNTAGHSAPSTEATATPMPPVPSAPAFLTATAGSGQVVLNWPTSPYATSYNIYSGLAPGAEAAAPIATGVTATTYTSTSLNNGTPYYYTVVAVNAAGQSAPSTEASATPIAAAGTMLSLRFGGSLNGVPGFMAPTESAGVIPAVGWNNVVGSSGTVPSLLDNLGGSTGASATWQASATWALPITEAAGSTRMMMGYLDNGSGNSSSTSTVSITNLPASITALGYDVYIYADGDNGGGWRTASYTVNGTMQMLTDGANTNFSGVFTQAVSGGVGNYLMFPNQTGSSFTLTATSGAATDGLPRAPINGIEFVAHTSAGAHPGPAGH